MENVVWYWCISALYMKLNNTAFTTYPKAIKMLPRNQEQYLDKVYIPVEDWVYIHVIRGIYWNNKQTLQQLFRWMDILTETDPAKVFDGIIGISLNMAAYTDEQ